MRESVIQRTNCSNFIRNSSKIENENTNSFYGNYFTVNKEINNYL